MNYLVKSCYFRDYHNVKLTFSIIEFNIIAQNTILFVPMYIVRLYIYIFNTDLTYICYYILTTRSLFEEYFLHLTTLKYRIKTYYYF